MVAHNMLRTHGGKKIRFVIALDLIQCLKQIRQKRLILTSAPLSELPSDISTMVLLFIDFIECKFLPTLYFILGLLKPSSKLIFFIDKNTKYVKKLDYVKYFIPVSGFFCRIRNSFFLEVRINLNPDPQPCLIYI